MLLGNVELLSTLKINDYPKVLISTLKNTLLVLLPLICIVFLIEVGFELYLDNSISSFFTLKFINYFLFHNLMFILYLSVFLLTLIVNIILAKIGNQQHNKPLKRD